MFFTENNDLPVRGQGATLWGYWRVEADPMARLASIPKANTVRYDTLKGPLPTYVNNDLASGGWCSTEFILLLWVAIFYFIILFFASVGPQINRMKYWLVKPPTFPIVNLKLFQHLFYSELLFQYSETLSSVLSSFSSHGSKQPSELTLDIVHHSTSQFFSPYPEHTVKACTSHQGVMMAHSVTQGHLRHLWFSMLKVDTLYIPTQKKIWCFENTGNTFRK